MVGCVDTSDFSDALLSVSLVSFAAASNGSYLSKLLFFHPCNHSFTFESDEETSRIIINQRSAIRNFLVTQLYIASISPSKFALTYLYYVLNYENSFFILEFTGNAKLCITAHQLKLIEQTNTWAQAKKCISVIIKSSCCLQRMNYSNVWSMYRRGYLLQNTFVQLNTH